MTITYPLALPTITGLAEITLRRVDVTAFSASPYTGDEQVFEYSGKWWEADITLPPLDSEEAPEWEAFLAKLRGHYGTFLMGDPAKATPRGSAGGSPLVDGGHAQRTSELTIKGATANQTGWLKAGDHIQLGSGSTSRLHENLNDVDTDSSGGATLDLWPTIRDTLSGDEAITLVNPKGVFRRKMNSFEASRQPGIFSYINFSAREALNG